VAQLSVTRVVEATALIGEPAPSTMGVIWERSTILGKSEIFTLALRWGAGSSNVTRSRAVPRLESVAQASWCKTPKDDVVPACAAEGHVTVARLRSTTLSARHQVGNRWNMRLQATCGHVLTWAPTTLHSQ
jgi:hypothetical protein